MKWVLLFLLVGVVAESQIMLQGEIITGTMDANIHINESVYVDHREAYGQISSRKYYISGSHTIQGPYAIIAITPVSITISNAYSYYDVVVFIVLGLFVIVLIGALVGWIAYCVTRT